MVWAKKNRSDIDDPVLHPELRKPTAPGAPIAPGGGGSALAPTSSASPILVARSPGNYPVGGQSVAITNPANPTAHFVTSSDSLTNVLQWNSSDGNSRRGFVTLVTSNLVRASTDHLNAAVWVRITMGSPRGSITFWQMAPAIVPVQGTYLRCDALIASAGNQLAYGGTLPSAPVIPVLNGPYSWNLSANFFDEDADLYPGPSVLGPSLQVCDQANAPQWEAPAIIDSIELVNTNATAGVFIVVADTTAPVTLLPGEDSGVVFVPAQSTVSVGRNLLGSFSSGVALFGTTTFTGTFTDDPNGANVFATIRGIFLQPGS